ncbi:MAG: hypothetical protein DCF22_11665 [Leptolyngbya sp.]|nr:MAG: hypothetical protein DCF22_11665 [Leptolyngbya sp.]
MPVIAARSPSPPAQLATKPRSLVPKKRVHPLKPKVKGIRVAGAIALIILLSGGIAGCGWLALQLIVNPQSSGWVNQWFPGWLPSRGAEHPPKTLQAIRAELRSQGKTTGELLELGQNVSFMDDRTPATDLLLPVLEQRPNCQTDCDQIVELRLYQMAIDGKTATSEPLYSLVDQLAIAGPEESFAIAPLVDAKSDNQGSSRALPLTSVTRYDLPSAQGVWLNLGGKRDRGNETLAYGQIIHYNPSRFHLSKKLQWTSPTGENPIWKEVTGGGSPELIINHTIGMEPQFEIYQIKPLNFLPSPVQLEPISLSESVLPQSAYQSALLLARGGLWSTSLKWLESLKRKLPAKDWSSTAQAQLDLIRWHAQVTQVQAESSWASPSQQVLANLIDGRWERALQVFQSSVVASHETADVLKADGGALENRIKAFGQTGSDKLEVRAWGALLLTAQKGQPAAIAWLKKQPKVTAAEIAQITALTKRLDPAFTENTLTSNSSRMIGTVQPLAQMNPADWSFPSGKEPLQADQQSWYQVTVTAFHTGDRWQSDTFSNLPTTAIALWKRLGLDTTPTLQLVTWQPNGEAQTVLAAIQAVRLQGDRLQLLVSGDASTGSSKPASHALAITESALQWLSPDVVSLGHWMQRQPKWTAKAIPALTQELQQAIALPTGTDLETLASHWTIQLANLTGSTQPDVILTLQPDDLTTLNPSLGRSPQSSPWTQPRTLIFSSSGKLLYSELSVEKGQHYRAISDLGNPLPTLVVDSPKQYKLVQWSTKRQQFE